MSQQSGLNSVSWSIRTGTNSRPSLTTQVWSLGPPYSGRRELTPSAVREHSPSSVLILSKTKPTFCLPQDKGWAGPQSFTAWPRPPPPTAAALALLRPLECPHSPDKTLPTFKVELQSRRFQKVLDSGTLFLPHFNYLAIIFNMEKRVQATYVLIVYCLKT
jgi:hypothetical protein